MPVRAKKGTFAVLCELETWCLIEVYEKCHTLKTKMIYGNSLPILGLFHLLSNYIIYIYIYIFYVILLYHAFWGGMMNDPAFKEKHG